MRKSVRTIIEATPQYIVRFFLIFSKIFVDMNMLALIMAVIVFYIAVTNDMTWTQGFLAAAFIYIIFAIASSTS